MEDASDPAGRAGEPGSFGVARERWLGGLGNVRNVVRQEMITRQLGRHLPGPPARVLDVGAGQGTQSLRLARAGHQVVAAEPDPDMRAQLQAVAVDLAELDPPAPSDPRRLAALLDAEERLGATDPYRQLAQLAHLILRRPQPGRQS